MLVGDLSISNLYKRKYLPTGKQPNANYTRARTLFFFKIMFLTDVSSIPTAASFNRYVVLKVSDKVEHVLCMSWTLIENLLSEWTSTVISDSISTQTFSCFFLLSEMTCYRSEARSIKVAEPLSLPLDRQWSNSAQLERKDKFFFNVFRLRNAPKMH